MKLRSDERAGFDGCDDRAVVLRLRRDDRVIGGTTREAVSEIDVGAVETVENDRAVPHCEFVPAHVRDAPGTQPLDGPAQKSEPAAALIGLLEQELHPDADPGCGPA